MIPVFVVVALGGGTVLAAVAGRWRQPTLLDRLTSSARAPKAQALPRETPGATAQSTTADTPGAVRSSLTGLDEVYQTFVQTHLDPWLVGRLRDEQMLVLTKGELRELNPMEKRTNRGLALGAGGLMLIVLTRLTAWPLTPVVVALGIYNSWPGVRESWRIAVEERRFSLLHLMLLYVGSLWFGGNYLIGTLGIIFGGMCQKVELLTQTVTRHNLTHLLGEQPSRVWVVKDNVEIQIPFEKLQLGDVVVLTAGQPVPVDGVVVQGTATVDQHRLTGESQPVEKLSGDPVLAATLVLGGKIFVRVEKTGAETAAAHIGDVLNRTVERQEISLADQFKDVEKYRWPMLAGGALGWLIRGPAAAMAMLGCNFMLSQVPLRLLTLLNGLGTGAERGILIKDGRALERLTTIDTVVFDKTGTLTLERQQVVRIHCCADDAEAEVLAFAAAAEQRQSHPIAQAILTAAAERQLTLPFLDEAHVELGFGLKALIQGQRVWVGSERFLAMEHLMPPPELLDAQAAAHAQGHALVFVAVGEAVTGAIELAAVLRPEAKDTVAWLRHEGLALYILSGDQDAPTSRLAAELGMDGFFANTLPEQKAERVKALQEQGRKVCFIGDGINDAIALRQAEVSISLRGATTVATDAAQVVLMDDDLNQLRWLWELAEGFERSLASNNRRSQQFSLLAAAGVLALPFGFWTTELLWSVQIIVGVRIAQQTLLVAEVDDEPGH
jgi:Cu2+-exporting ATPase